MTNFHKGQAWLERAEKKDFHPGGAVYDAMELGRQGTSVAKAKKQQDTLDIKGLPWPLSVPWSGSFLTSTKPRRDLVSHGVFADIEMAVVQSYRRKMIEKFRNIGSFRLHLEELLQSYMEEGLKFKFADGINFTLDIYGELEFEEHETVLLNHRLSASSSQYKSEVNDIIKFFAKQPVMLSHPSGDKDSAKVRNAFKDFIEVSCPRFRDT